MDYKMTVSPLLSIEDCKKRDNLKKINDIAAAAHDWNGYGASPFSLSLITKVTSIIEHLSIQPKVFPTARNSIQLEFEKKTGEYLEFEIFESEIIVFAIDQDDSETEFVFPFT